MSCPSSVFGVEESCSPLSEEEEPPVCGGWEAESREEASAASAEEEEEEEGVMARGSEVGSPGWKVGAATDMCGGGG